MSSEGRNGDSELCSPREVEPLTISFQNLAFTVPVKRKYRRDKQEKHKDLLKSISGRFAAGRLTAIMGPSGAGKTTLLSVLAGNSTNGKLTGHTFVNGAKCDPDDLNNISGFVFQEDVLLPFMTVEEAILMSATLRLPKEMRGEERRQRVAETIETMRLQAASHTIVGSTLRKGISGGERKRTAIGMELVTHPPVLFLDEPTTGLDTFTAFMVIKSLSDLARKGCTVVATIHQPSTEIFNLFDDLVLMSRGQIAYMGEASKSVAYFANIGYHCPRHSNPGDYYFMHVLREFGEIDETLELSNAPSPTPSSTNLLHDPAHESALSEKRRDVVRSSCDERIEKVLSNWKESDECQQLERLLASYSANGVAPNAIRSHAPVWRQFRLLLGRSAKNLIRDYAVIISRLFQAIFLGLLVGLAYAETNNYGVYVQIINKSGALSFFAINVFFAAATQIMTIFAEEKQVFYREYNSGYYYLAPYYVAKTLVEVPGQIVGPFLMIIIAYYLVGLDPAFSSYLMIALLASLGAVCGNAFGTLLAAIFDDLSVALALMPVIVLPIMLVSSVFAAQVKDWIGWIRYISPIYYSFSGMMDVQFSNDFTNCDSTKLDCSGAQAFTTLNFNSVFPPGVDVVFLVVIFFVLWIFGFIALYIGANYRKR